MMKRSELDVDLIRQAASQKLRKTIAIYSPEIAAVMWYLKETVPKFSISEEARKLIKEGLERDYPELVKKIKDEMAGTYGPFNCNWACSILLSQHNRHAKQNQRHQNKNKFSSWISLHIRIFDLPKEKVCVAGMCENLISRTKLSGDPNAK
jgi:hypothetical protein